MSTQIPTNIVERDWRIPVKLDPVAVHDSRRMSAAAGVVSGHQGCQQRLLHMRVLHADEGRKTGHCGAHGCVKKARRFADESGVVIAVKKMPKLQPACNWPLRQVLLHHDQRKWGRRCDGSGGDSRRLQQDGPGEVRPGLWPWLWRATHMFLKDMHQMAAQALPNSGATALAT